MRLIARRLACALAIATLVALDAAPVCAQDSLARLDAGRRERLTHATHAYGAGDFARALRVLISMRNAVPSAALERNIAACHFRLEDYARALTTYENAARGSTSEPMIEACRARLALPVRDEIDEGDFASLWLLLAVVAVIAQAAGARLLLRRAPTPSPSPRSKSTRAGLGALLMLAGLAAAVLVLVRSGPSGARYARVVGAEAQAYAEPHASSAALRTVAPGTKLRVVELSRDWARVEHPRITAWIPRNQLALLSP